MRLANCGLLTLLGLTAPLQALDLFLSVSQGYTHYEAKDLNQVLVLLEKTTQAGGFNNYEVSSFDGHLQKAVTMGFQTGKWTFALETEFWTESFSQTEVPFDLENSEREHRIDCESLRADSENFEGLAGCVQAWEVFHFLPITLQASRNFRISPSWSFSPGAALGVMAGSATIRMKSDYFGIHSLPSDEISYSIYPGINPVQKYFLDLEFRPSWWWGGFLGLQARAGWRISHMPGFKLRGQKGESRVFDIVFPEAEDGAVLYIQSVTSNPDDNQIFLGTEQSARAQAEISQSSFHAVTGDFTGWFGAVKVNFYWGFD